MIRKDFRLNNRFVIGNIGRMSYAKNQLFLVDCFYEVQKKVANAVLLLVGNGELEMDIREKVEEYGIADKVILTGAVEKTEDYLQGMDVFALDRKSVV